MKKKNKIIVLGIALITFSAAFFFSLLLSARHEASFPAKLHTSKIAHHHKSILPICQNETFKESKKIIILKKKVLGVYRCHRNEENFKAPVVETILTASLELIFNDCKDSFRGLHSILNNIYSDHLLSVQLLC